MAVANNTGTLFVWQLNPASPESEQSSLNFNPEPLTKLHAHKSYVLKTLFSPDVKWSCHFQEIDSPGYSLQCLRTILSSSGMFQLGSWSGLCWVTSDGSGMACFQTTRHFLWRVSSCTFSFDIKGSSDQTARLWDVCSGETVRHYTGHHKAVIAVALADSSEQWFLV